MIETISLGITSAQLVAKINEIIAAVNDIQPATSYAELQDKPAINGVTLAGNKTTADLLIALSGATDYATLLETLATKKYTEGVTEAAVAAAEAAAESALEDKLDADTDKIDKVSNAQDADSVLIVTNDGLKKMAIANFADVTMARNAAKARSIENIYNKDYENIPLTGLINGTNTRFTNSTGWIPGTTKVFLDGTLLARNTDYVETDRSTIETTGITPQTGQRLIMLAVPLS